MYRTFVILRHAFLEAVLQPIYLLLLALGGAILIIFGLLPFFTMGEDTIMFKAVGLDVILVLVLIMTLFATSKTIFDEIEDRTMLTLMSKPVRRWEVLVGKYLGIILAALLAIAILGVVLILCTWYRIPNDYQLRAWTLDDRELSQIHGLRIMHIAGLVPSLILVWFEIAVLAAISVALSTRFSLVVNLPVVILIYIAGNLTRFLFPLTDQSPVVKFIAWAVALVFPYLANFDLRSLTVYHDIAVRGTQFWPTPGVVQHNVVYLSQIWAYVGIAALYGIAYSAFALSAGMWLFKTRELGGAEG
ncbi:MAG TPA: ABC transporter permease subunit [Tepidisphaeraceae bacterium]|jgi:ABC-type transport system involved in multi-copper enzyme maturation permease subunit